MSKAFQLPDTTGARALIVMIEVDSDWEQSISLSIDGRDFGRYTGSGECMMQQLQLEPGRERDCQLICNHQAPGQAWTENEYIDPVIKHVRDAHSIEIRSYDQSTSKQNGASASVCFTWWW